MADFCNICTTQIASGNFESENIGDILMNYRLLSGGDINIDKLFDEHIKNNMENFLSDEFYGMNLGGICEHCGLSRLTVKKEDDVLYLVAWCYKNSKENNTAKYKIAIINQNNELEYQEDELVKYYEEM
jgi:aspartate 1-decarboxylase